VQPNPTRSTNPSLDECIATPEGKRRYVGTLFAKIAERYDFITVRCRTDRTAGESAGRPAAPSDGARRWIWRYTGDIAFALAARGAHVVGLDVTRR
jgi:hypothetical protein